MGNVPMVPQPAQVDVGAATVLAVVLVVFVLDYRSQRSESIQNRLSPQHIVLIRAATPLPSHAKASLRGAIARRGSEAQCPSSAQRLRFELLGV